VSVTEQAGPAATVRRCGRLPSPIRYDQDPADGLIDAPAVQPSGSTDATDHRTAGLATSRMSLSVEELSGERSDLYSDERTPTLSYGALLGSYVRNGLRSVSEANLGSAFLCLAFDSPD